MLNMQGENKRILNIDETPVGYACFQQKAWVPRNGWNFSSQHQIWPRITMIAGTDNFGNLYYALLQANSNADTLRLFFYRLVEILDKENNNWRENTIIQVDGASWHTNNETQALLKFLNIPTMITGPY